MAEERVQRRLAAILAADVVGYSRLMEADEEGTRACLRSLLAERIEPRIAADGGRIVKTTDVGPGKVWKRHRCAYNPQKVRHVPAPEVLFLFRDRANLEWDRPNH